MLYGFSLDRVAISLKVNSDGSAVVSHRYLSLFVHGGRKSASGAATAGQPFLADCELEVQAIHTCQIPEKVEHIASQLDAIFSRSALDLTHSHQFSENRVTEIFGYDREFARNDKAVKWQLDLKRGLPEHFWHEPAPGTDITVGRPMAVLLYEVRLRTAPGAYATTGSDYLTWTGEIPCRVFSLSVSAADDAPFQFWIEKCDVTVRTHEIAFPTEEERVSTLIGGGTHEVHLPHPLPGTQYKFHWSIAAKRTQVRASQAHNSERTPTAARTGLD